ncbi:MAG: hypothetical protein HZR80_19605 [Candidatus Heimdallarchaeota archaeon]
MSLQKLGYIESISYLDFSLLEKVKDNIEKEKQNQFGKLITFEDFLKNHWEHLIVIILSVLVGSILGAIITILTNYFGLVK